MELRRYLSILRRHAALVLAIVVAAVAAGYLVAPKGHTYTATSTLYVGERAIDVSPTAGELSGNRVAGFDRLIGTFSAMVSTNKIAAAAIANAQVDRSPGAVAASTTAKQPSGTNLIAVSVTDRSAAVSRKLADGAASALIDQVHSFEPRTTTADADQVLSLYEAAPSATLNHSPLKRDLGLAGLLGLIVAGIVLALLEHLDITVRSAEDAERELDVPVLAVVPSLGRQLPLAPTASSDERLPRAKESAGRTGSLQ
jgi:capsular polysaccharide biosynthesis protein